MKEPVLLSPIQIDDRTPHIQGYKRGLERLSVHYSITRLFVGDFEWSAQPGGIVVVEHKKVEDFWASVGDGRLARFVQETGGPQTPEGLTRAVLVEGDTFKAKMFGREWSVEQTDEELGSLQDMGIRVLRCPDGAAIDRLVAFWHHTGNLRPSGLLRTVLPQLGPTYKAADGTTYIYSDELRRAVRAIMAATGGGIGETKALAILEELKSPGAALDAILRGDYGCFKAVRGVGKGLLTSATEFLQREVRV